MSCVSFCSVRVNTSIAPVPFLIKVPSCQKLTVAQIYLLDMLAHFPATFTHA